MTELLTITHLSLYATLAALAILFAAWMGVVIMLYAVDKILVGVIKLLEFGIDRWER